MIYKSDQIKIDYIRILIINHKFDLKPLQKQLKNWNFKFQYNEIINVKQQETTPKPFIPSNTKLKIAKWTYDSYKNKWYLVSWGIGANYIYENIKAIQLNNDDLKICRIDIAYDRLLTKTENYQSIQSFFTDCRNHCLKIPIDCIINENLLTVNKRRNTYFLRIYIKQERFLRFELEIKKLAANRISKLLFTNEIKLHLEKIFLTYLKKHLPLEKVYLDWVRDYFRITNFKNQTKPFFGILFVSGYINESASFKDFTLKDYDQIYQFYRLISFLNQLDFNKYTQDSEFFYTTTFLLTDFVEHGDVKNQKIQKKLQENNRAKVLKILKQFTNNNSIYNIRITTLLEDSFRSVTLIPLFKIYKQKNRWFVQVTVSKDLFNYSFRFSYNSINRKMTQSETLIWVFVMGHFFKETKFKCLELTYLLHAKNLNSKIKQLRASLLVKQLDSMCKQKLIYPKFTLHYRTNSKFVIQNKLTEFETQVSLNELKNIDLLNFNLIVIYENFD